MYLWMTLEAVNSGTLSVFSYIRLDFTHNLHSGTGRNTWVLCDTGTEYLFCLANVNSSIDFVSASINDIRSSQLRNLILVREAITNSVRALEQYPQVKLWVKLSDQQQNSCVMTRTGHIPQTIRSKINKDLVHQN